MAYPKIPRPSLTIPHAHGTRADFDNCERCNPFPQYQLVVDDGVVDSGPAAAHPDGATHVGLGLVASSDARLTDARTPTAHGHAVGDTSGLQAELDGKAATHAHPYAATAHGHAIADTTGLQSAINGKADTHTHPYEASGAVATHAGLADPHPGYLTSAEGNAAYATAAHAHAAPILADQDIPASIARDSEVTSAVSTHAATPHGSAPLHTNLANDTTALALATNTSVRLTVTANRTLTTTVPVAGSVRTVLILTSGSSSFTITFGTGFKPTGTLATGTTTARVFALSFISDGTNLYETGRTVAMVA